MKLENLVNKKNLIKCLEQEAFPIGSAPDYLGLSLDHILSIVEACPISSKELEKLVESRREVNLFKRMRVWIHQLFNC